MTLAHVAHSQDMAVKHAVLGFEEWQREHGQLEAIEAPPADGQSTDTPASSASAEATDDDDDDDLTDAALDVLEKEDPLSLMDGIDEERVGTSAEGPSTRASFASI